VVEEKWEEEVEENSCCLLSKLYKNSIVEALFYPELVVMDT